jgi:uncharacterized membrane protein YfcA
MRTVDRIFGWLMVAATSALVIFLQPFYSGSAQPLVLLTALCGLLLGAMNLMRAERPHDRTLARICVGGNAAFGILMATLEAATGRRLFPAMIMVLCLVLLILSMRTRKRSRPM